VINEGPVYQFCRFGPKTGNHIYVISVIRKRRSDQ